MSGTKSTCLKHEYRFSGDGICRRCWEEAVDERESLRARIAELEKDQGDWRKGVELIASSLGEKKPPNLCCSRISEMALSIRADNETLSRQLADYKAQENRLREALSELADLMDAILEGEYTPDSFTTQPARNALATNSPCLHAVMAEKTGNAIKAANKFRETWDAGFTNRALGMEFDDLRSALDALKEGSNERAGE